MCAALAVSAGLIWLACECLLVVPPKKVAALIRKTGEDLPPDQIIALSTGQKGIHEGVVLEGWHLLNPYTWTWEVMDQVTVSEGQVGVRIRRHGEVLPVGAILAGSGQRGITREVLRPGRYAVNRLAEGVELHDAVTVVPGHVGVVCVVAGPVAGEPNTFLVGEGERGIQREVVQPGTFYVNPYERRIYPVDLRSQILTAAGTGAIQFPSKDGFPITMEGTIEWRIDPRRVAQVFVEHVDRYQSARDVTDAVAAKVIVPHARAFCHVIGAQYLARDFISGETRRKFQDEFGKRMAVSCEAMGVLIKDALARKTIPPEEIALPIRNREIAIRMREKYLQEMERERQEKQLAMTKRLEERRRVVNKAQADAAVAVALAEQERDVALIEARQQFEVARQQLEAAKNEAKARVVRARADADVQLLDNAAEVRGVAESSRALGGGAAYVRSLLNEKLAPAVRSILSNTEGPFADLIKQALAPGAPIPKR